MSFNNLPENTVYLTGYSKALPTTLPANTTEPVANRSILLPPRPLTWRSYDSGKMPMAVAYINALPADLNNDADLAYNAARNNASVGLVSSNGAVLRYVDLAPGYTCMMHRTRSLDYGVVVAGEAECVMDSGGVQRMKLGDVMVQRYTMHAWRNPSKTEWTRILFVLMDCEELTVDGHKLGEDLGRGKDYVPKSGNDA